MTFQDGCHLQYDISQYWRDREIDKQDLAINYCTTLDMDFSILKETHVSFSHLRDIRELWDREVIIWPEKTQACGVLVLTKRSAPPIEQIIADPAGRYVSFKIKNTTDVILALYISSGKMKNRHMERQMFIRKINELLYKKIIGKNDLILLGDFNMTLG